MKQYFDEVILIKGDEEIAMCSTKQEYEVGSVAFYFDKFVGYGNTDWTLQTKRLDGKTVLFKNVVIDENIIYSNGKPEVL